jgi:hypothetical protein
MARFAEERAVIPYSSEMRLAPVLTITFGMLSDPHNAGSDGDRFRRGAMQTSGRRREREKGGNGAGGLMNRFPGERDLATNELRHVEVEARMGIRMVADLMADSGHAVRERGKAPDIFSAHEEWIVPKIHFPEFPAAVAVSVTPGIGCVAPANFPDSSSTPDWGWASGTKSWRLL